MTHYSYTIETLQNTDSTMNSHLCKENLDLQSLQLL